MRYSFAKVPTVEQAAASPLKLEFEGGNFISKDGTPIFAGFAVHDDGIVVNTRTSTDEANRFLRDVLAWFANENDLPVFDETQATKIYASELLVELDAPLEILNPKFRRFADLLGKMSAASYPSAPIELTGFHFSGDKANLKNAHGFRFERQVNQPFSANRYYSSASLQTHDHIALLEELAEAVGG